MDILVKHNGDNITSSVLSYERVHEICTGIGTLTIEIERTIGRNFDPWDSIDIHENGDFKVRYYVSAERDDIPLGKITLDCQDLSKRLVDFFIPESYTIEEPSYTRYWIELFLDMAGVDYHFETSSPGNLLSNHTQLGLVPAYEQILTLLQLSGWYMFFDGSGTAVIGPLQTDLADSAGSVDGNDILSISKLSDDKMLRNRALVLGTFDIYTMSYAVADVTVHTRWNYDRRDVRAMVVSNSNIPNKGSAYKIANILLKEFARITEEKRMELHGARDYVLGEALRVNSRIWRGKGLITTFGVRMSKDGLITDVILDQRCPRLFGFFDFGDYVYVGTYGDGVWRKHLKFIHTWENFSTGLTDLNITDLHINNGVFGAIASGGEMYYRPSEEGSWSQITITGLMSSQEDTVPSGELVTYVGFSGLMGRATIVDKLSNTVKFAIDTASGWNTGDYFLDWYPSGVLSSGVSVPSGVLGSGQMRSWIVEYDPYTGNPVGGLGSGIYPVSYSGNYALTVVDLENDGVNDYISVATTSSGVSFEDGYNFGRHNSSLTFYTHDNESKVGFSSFDYSEEGQTKTGTLSTGAFPYFAVFQNEFDDERDVIYIQQAAGTTTLRRLHVYKEFSPSLGRNEVLSTTTISPSLTGLGTLLGIGKVSVGVYRLFHLVSSGAGPLVRDVNYRVWDSINNTISTDTTASTINLTVGALTTTNVLDTSVKIINNIIYVFHTHFHRANNDTTDAINYLKIYRQTVDMSSLSSGAGEIVNFEFEPWTSTNNWVIRNINGSNQVVFIGQKGNVPSYAMWICEQNHVITSSATSLRNYLISSENGSDFELDLVQTATTSSDANFLTSSTTAETVGTQLHENHSIFYVRKSSGVTRPGYIYNGSTVSIVDLTAGIPTWWASANVYPTYGNNRPEYLTKIGSDWYWIDIPTLTASLQIPTNTEYSISKPFSNAATEFEQFFWYANDNESFRNVILRTNRAGTVEAVIDPFAQPNFGQARGKVSGNFFFDMPLNITSFTSTLRYLYVDNVYPGSSVGTYMVLQREGSEFNLVQQETYPIRLDISNSTPVLTVGSGFDSFTSNYISNGELEVIFPLVGSGVGFVEDYRYTLLEPSYGEVPSGLGVQMMGLYVHGSGIYATDVRTYSGGWQLFYDIPSGYGTRIETSNYGAGGQYVFVTSSGFVQTFFQKDPEDVTFTAYSGIPQSRATIIRLDDRM